jgi:UDP-N-acetylmuramoyl-L-alanyl-D-glutamate--2,6-diaminopimelate ligase
MDTPTDAFAIVTDENLYGVQFVVNVLDKLSRICLPLTGKHNVYNALAAIVCATELGISLAEISSGLQLMNKVDGRLEFVRKFNGADIFVDFAHTPDGLKKSIESLKLHTKGRLICVFGCGGNRDKSKRIPMGEAVAKKADFSVITSDNPRYEDPMDIISSIEKGYRRFSSQYVIVPDRKKGIEYALELIDEGDVLLLAGKGAEEYQEIMGIKYAFKDKDVIEELITQKKSLF